MVARTAVVFTPGNMGEALKHFQQLLVLQGLGCVNPGSIWINRMISQRRLTPNETTHGRSLDKISHLIVNNLCLFHLGGVVTGSIAFGKASLLARFEWSPADKGSLSSIIRCGWLVPWVLKITKYLERLVVTGFTCSWILTPG